MNKRKKIHPISILENLRFFLFLLIIPFLRGLLYYILNGGVYIWIKGAWIDIFIIMVILGLSIIKWNRTFYTCNEYCFVFETGIFFKKSITIPKDKITYLSTYSPFYYRPFKAIKLKCDAFSGKKNSTEIDITVNKSDIDDIILVMNLNDKLDLKKEKIFISKTIHIIALSMILSNSFAGILLVLAFISNIGKIVGEELENQIYTIFTHISKDLAFGFPPAGVALAYIILAGWLMAFFKNFRQYIKLYIKRSNNNVITNSGILNYRTEYINLDSLNFVDIVQSVFTRLIGIYSIFIQVSGSGKNKKDLMTIIPATTKHKLWSNIDMLINSNFTHLFEKNENYYRCTKFYKYITKPKLNALGSFIVSPLQIMSISIILEYLLLFQYPNWSNFIKFITMIFITISLWLTIVKIMDFFSSELSKYEDYYIIKYSRKFQLHTIIIPINKVAKIEIYQNIFQKISGNCDVIIYPFSTTKIKHYCKNIDKINAKNLLNLSI